MLLMNMQVEKNDYPELKIVNEDIEVEFSLNKVMNEQINVQTQIIDNEIYKIDQQLMQNEILLENIDKEIDRLTNQADYIDYLISFSSGILASIIDIFLVGEFNLERGREFGSEKVDDFVMKVAKLTGYEGEDNLSKAVAHLEKFGTPSDSNTMDFGGSLQHHLRDFAHHPTPVGLIFSLLTQFTEKSYGTDKNGRFKIEPVRDTEFIGENIPEKILFGVIYWFLHMVSDMAGSRSTAGAGTGLPGPLLSFAKELSALPFFQNIEINGEKLTVWISKLFNGTLLAKRDEDGKIKKPLRFDLRAEIGILNELKRQSLPVLINECVVRGFYFIRRFTMQIKEKDIVGMNELDKIEWKKTLPFKNRTVVRMLTVAMGTYTTVDMLDASIRSVTKSRGNYSRFVKEFALRVNVLGVGRFTFALGTDLVMGMKRNKQRNERISVIGEQLHLLNSKIFYSQAKVWIEAETTERTILEAYKKMEETMSYFFEIWIKNRESMRNIGNYRTEIEMKNPKLINEMIDVLKWG